MWGGAVIASIVVSPAPGAEIAPLVRDDAATRESATAEGRSKRPGRSARYRSLDGLRALAILLVLLFHSTNPFQPADIEKSYLLRFFTTGWNGVNLFFVLSGFLVGSLALRELQRTDGILLLRFWSRRMFRTWPLYFVLLFVAYWSQGDRPVQPAFWHYLTFTQNFFDTRFFVQTWSLAVEEQFYFLLPLGLMLVARRKGIAWLPALAVVGIVVAALYRAGLGRSNNILSVMDPLLVGLLVAYLQQHRRAVLDPLISRGNWTLFGGVFLVYAPFALPDPSLVRNVFGETVAAVGFGLVMIAAFGRNAVSWLLESRVAFLVALVSYSIYLSHDTTLFYVIQLSNTLRLSGNLKLLFIELVGIPAACLIGTVLYFLIEKPFLTLRERLSPTEFRVA